MSVFLVVGAALLVAVLVLGLVGRFALRRVGFVALSRQGRGL